MFAKRMMIALSTMLVITGLVGCSSAPAPKAEAPVQSAQPAPAKDAASGFKMKGQKLKVGFSQYTLAAPYFAELVASAKREAEKQGIDFVAVDAQDDMNKQLANVEDLLAKNIDILLMNPKDPKGAIPAVKAAQKAGVPVIILDSSIDPSAPVVTTIQSNNLENGKLVGEWIANQMKGKQIKAAVLSGAAGNPVGQARRDGVFIGIIEGQLRNGGTSSLNLVAQGWGNWGETGGQKAMEDILVAHKDINLLITENDSMALGAMKAIKEAKLENQILIAAAADGQKEAIKLIQDGTQYGATGSNNPAVIGKMGIEIALKIAKGETEFQKITFTPPLVITKENASKNYDPNAGF